MDRDSEQSNGLNDVDDTGVVSIKDFAYDKSDALHYGYFGDHYEEDTDEELDGQDRGGDESSGEQGGNITSFAFQKNGSELRDSSTSNGDKYNNEDFDDSDSEDVMTKRQSIVLPANQIVNSQAIALYDFTPENDNELELHEGDTLFIGYRHGQGWLVAENEERTRTGLVPEEYVTLIEAPESASDNEPYTTEGDEIPNYDASDDVADDDNDAKPRPFYLTHMIAQSMAAPSHHDEPDQEWEDIDDVGSSLQENLKVSES
ncbi:adaptor protein NBP2 LALA0_S03e02190g [Lachancea lanzarotensis]|uniref:LALA0S03e02190g1_1 n=1 Tax=Lachancea lanzarotensis TaxID=1245769 RepID=A0A0C7MV36_9SACH|nr:uncharacterized protein LALA0_S03e02190g [Lachancea lanzarotensis]CEP61408.1 LALA0S03e02190g1_1 [Lachancea lanzarotensis]